MKPTMELRWHRVYKRKDDVPCTTIPSWPENSDELYELQQLWISEETGDKEWKPIKAE